VRSRDDAPGPGGAEVPRDGPARRVATLAAVPVALLASTVLVWQSSAAVVRAEARAEPDAWVAGRVVIGHGLDGRALFAQDGLGPAASGETCTVVTYSGDVDARVRLYVTGLGPGDTLAPHLDVTVETGVGGSDGSCAGFVADPAPAATGTLAALAGASTFATGVGEWRASAGDARTYRVAWRVHDDDAAQGRSAEAGFVWEAQSLP
jgi:hypothetical protein